MLRRIESFTNPVGSQTTRPECASIDDHASVGNDGLISRLSRRSILCAALGLSAFSGCSLFDRRGDDSAAGVSELANVPTPPETIGMATNPVGLDDLTVTGIGVVNGLPGTGGAPDPSELRETLIDEMKRRDVASPEVLLETPETGMAQVFASIPAGARAGDRLDVKVVAPESANVRHLAGGWLLETRLQQQMVVNAGPFGGRETKRGDVMTLASGGVITRATYENSESLGNQLEGLILGGGKVQSDREFGLSLQSKFQHAALASMVEKAVNDRFFFFDGASRRGIAKATSDQGVRLETPPRYQNSLHRLVAVIEHIPFNPDRRQSQARIQELAVRLADPATAADAALGLEAVGESATAVLLNAIKSENPEVRFRAAMALAYLDQPEAVQPLAQLIREQAAFRVPALRALQDMRHASVESTLQSLTRHESLETAYGALITLMRRGTTVGMPKQTKFRDFRVIEIPDAGVRPTIAASLQEGNWIVCFGDVGHLQLESFLRNNRGYLIRPLANDSLSLKRFRPGGEDQDFSATAKSDWLSVMAGLDQIGASYADVLGLLQLAREREAMEAMVVVDPMPKGQRVYFREDP